MSARLQGDPPPPLDPSVPGDLAPPPWVTPAGQVALDLDVDPAAGLTSDEAARRLITVGENRLAEHKGRPAVLRFLDQFRSVLILVLIGAAVLAGLVGELKDTVVITVVLLINATIGFVQEQRAERSLDALRRMLAPATRVRRNHQVVIIDADQVVPGDVVLLEAGDRVPADGRLTVAAGVEVDESALTGESVPVVKTADAVTGGSAVPLAERLSMVHMNTALTRGRAEVVVTATGMNTEVGGIAELLAAGKEPPSPLAIELDSLGKRLAAIGGAAVAVYCVLALLRGEAIGELALRAVALAVAAVPEGLPAVLALTLALGVQRMAGRSAIVKRLASVETLGSTTVICSDKTGTLTLNQMVARVVWTAGQELRATTHGLQDPSGTASPPPAQLLRSAVLCNDASPGPDGVIGDPTEAALLTLADGCGVDAASLQASSPRLGEVPFDPATKYMATLHAAVDGHGTELHVKGAAEVLLSRCIQLFGPGGAVPLDPARRTAVDEQVTQLAGRGLRVLAVASRRLPGHGPADPANAVDQLTLLGLVGIADPPRTEARDAIRLCGRAGVAVKMITGDHAATAAAIASELGIPGRVVTGRELDRMTLADLQDQVGQIGVFARVAPEHKVTIVQALIAGGHVVAMTGDGVNDAAALRSAHIGIAMGVTGTEVAKEASAMVLTDDNFATIVGAVEEGRGIYDNVVKFIRFQLSTNMGAIFTFLGSVVLGLPAPLTAVQILWVNIIMDGPPAMALGVDPPRPGLMDEPPRPASDRILSRQRVARLLRVGALMATGTLTVLVLADQTWGPAVGATMAFTTFVLFQIVNALNARVERATVFTRQLLTNRWLWLALATVLLLQIAAVHIPWLQAIFDTVPLTLSQWAICAGIALTVLVLEESIRLLARTRNRAQSRPDAVRDFR